VIGQDNLGGIFALANTTMTVTRMGNGAMQLAVRKCEDLRAIPAKLLC
jgi:hypothetical protein